MKRTLSRQLLLGFSALLLLSGTLHASWWNGDWSMRRKIVIDTSAKGAEISEPIGSAVVLIRLHDGNFQFSNAKEDGSDIRFVADDGKTLLSYQIEKFDSLLGEAFIWVKVPELKPNSQTVIWLYYGNTGNSSIKPASNKVYDADTVLVYHFNDKATPPTDSSAAANNAQTTGIPAEGSLIGTGLRLIGSKPVIIPASASLAWTQGLALTWSAWIKPTVLQPKAIIYSRREGANSFLVGLDNGIPFVEVNGERSARGAAIPVNSWHELTVVSASSTITLYLDGNNYESIKSLLPVLNSTSLIGADSIPGNDGFVGEMDELEITKASLSLGLIKLHAFNQGGGEKSDKFLTFGEDEQTSSWFSGGYFGIILKSLSVDGWVVICILMVMAVMSWFVMINKISYLNAISKGNALFLKEWKRVAEDLTVLDDAEASQFHAVGGRLDKEAEKLMRAGSVYRIYHLGVEEIRYRMAEDNAREGTRRGLAGRSIQAIRATLDGGLVRETQRINRLLVLLTICISGGPFLGLLGTVVGVMITFAAIAAAGDVNVNAIAPGIAAALVATVAGLAVAIPALFGYNYIISRVKDARDDMHIFIDEFVTKMAEFYRETPSSLEGRSRFVGGGVT